MSKLLLIQLPTLTMHWATVWVGQTRSISARCSRFPSWLTVGGRGRHRCDGACVSRQRGSERPPPGRTGPDRADCSRRAARSTEVSVVVLMRLIRRLFTASCCRPDDCRPPGTKPRQSRAAGAPTGYKRAQLRQGVCLGRVLSLSTCGPRLDWWWARQIEIGMQQSMCFLLNSLTHRIFSFCISFLRG